MQTLARLGRRDPTAHGALGKLESYLAKHRGWFALTEPQQRALTEAAELYEIDARLDALYRARHAIVRELPARMAESPRAVVLKLDIAARMLEFEGHDEVYGLLGSATRDLKRLCR